MKKNIAIETITKELISNQVNSTMEFLSDFTKVKKSVKYDRVILNDTKRKEFQQYKKILQSIVDSYYFGYYEVDAWLDITLDNIQYAINHNMEILKNMQKLLKFIS